MKLKLNYHELYAPYSKDASLEITLDWISREARKLGISEAVRDAAITDVFLEMSKGRKFPVGKCYCNRCQGDFGVEWSCVAMNHFLLETMIVLNHKVAKAVGEVLEKQTKDKFQTMLSEYIKGTAPWYKRIFKDFQSSGEQEVPTN